ncbi:hypothetical protein TrCOL_g7440 [Triparma columacea]|uniref:Uncharacterized protein n=1 Tax=Triparma columacea TaxID=722753 RepID=A0A9W7GSA3_9STRA|nr:hypothetical protein TrCOL_g7440 [Triparma columacea]
MLFPRDSINKDKCITVEVCGHKVRELNPDERTCALCLQRTLLQHAGVKAAERAVARTNENKYIPPAVPNSAKPGQIPKSERNAQRTERKARENMIRRIDKATAEFSPPAGFRVYADDSLNSLMERLNEVESGGQTFVLHEDGDPLWEYLESDPPPPLGKPVTIVLGDQKGILPQDEAALSSFSALRVSVGTLSLLTSQVITIVHHYLDRRHVSGPH